MKSDEARVHALKAALELRLGNSTPASVIAHAREFEAYIAAEGADTAKAPVTEAQAKQETASVAASKPRK